MTDHDDDPLVRALHALRAEYLAEAPAKLAELWSAFDQVQNGDREARARLRTLVHRLAGSGGAYGLPAVTEHARGAEQLLDRLPASPERPSEAQLAPLRAHLAGVNDAFDRARSTK